MRGHRYVFTHNATVSHPIQIRVASGGAAYTDGVTYSDTGNNRTTQGNDLIINVQHDAPARLYYQCTSHSGMLGNIYIVGGPQVISGVVTATTFSGSGASLTNLPAANLTGTLPALAAPNLTSLPAANLTGTLPAISGANLTSLPAQATIANNADNRVITGGSGVNLNGEANLTYDGTNLQLTTDANNEGIKIDGGVTYPVFEMDANRGAGNTLGKLVQKWNGTQVASISFVSGTDTSNKDDGIMYFNTASSGTPLERLRITSSGALGTNSTVRSANGGLDLCSQGATNLGTLTLGAGGGQNGQSRSSNQENQFRIMMPTYANPSNMTTVLYGTSGNAGHDLFYGGGTGWAYATNTHRFFTTANQTTGNGTERIRILSNGHVAIGDDISNDTGMFKVIAADGQSDDQYVGQFKNLEATTNRNWGLLIQAGSSSTDESLRVRNGANNADHLTIRGDGVVTKPKTPTFAAQGSGDAISAQSPLPYDSISYNNGSHYNSSTYKFNIPVNGYYYVTCHVVPTNFTTPNNVELYIKDDQGNRYFLDRKVKSNNYSTNNFSVGGSRILYKTAGADLWVELNSINGSPTLESSSHFGIMLMA